MTTNPAASLMFIRRIFNHLVVAAEALGVANSTDAADVAAWSEALAHLPTFNGGTATAAPYPVGEACPGNASGMVSCPPGETGTTVLLPQETPFYFKPGDNPLQLYAVWPGEQISLGSSEAVLDIARRTISLSAAWNEGNAPPEVYPAVSTNE